MPRICHRRVAICQDCHKACAAEEAERYLTYMRVKFPDVVRPEAEMTQMRRDLDSALRAQNTGRHWRKPVPLNGATPCRTA